ncbi:MAG: hypothetical protein ABH860_03950 [bacterium]
MKFKYWILIIIWSLVIGPWSFCLAARPLATDDYGTVDPGKYELEVGHASILNSIDPDDDTPVENTAYSGGISFKGGIIPGFDLGVEFPFSFSSPLGMNDSIIHAKYRIVELAEDEGITARADVKIANCNEDEGYGTDDTDYGLFLIYSKKIGDLNTHYNLGYTWVGITKGEKEGEEDNVTTASAALEYPLFGEMGDAVAEMVMTNAPYSNTGFAQIGARYNIGIARFDAGYSFGLNKYSIKNCVTVGMTFEF